MITHDDQERIQVNKQHHVEISNPTGDEWLILIGGATRGHFRDAKTMAGHFALLTLERDALLPTVDEQKQSLGIAYTRIKVLESKLAVLESKLAAKEDQ